MRYTFFYKSQKHLVNIQELRFGIQTRIVLVTFAKIAVPIFPQIYHIKTNLSMNIAVRIINKNIKIA